MPLCFVKLDYVKISRLAFQPQRHYFTIANAPTEGIHDTTVEWKTPWATTHLLSFPPI